MKRKIIFFNTHPIQYFAPLYREIEKSQLFDLEVWYASKQGLSGEVDRQFGTPVKWDIPILEGYKSRFFKNYSFKPGFYNGFWGLMNFGIFWALLKLPPKSVVIIHGWHPFSAIFTIICSKLTGHITCLRAETPLKHELIGSTQRLFIRKFFLKYFLFRFVDKFLYIGQQNRSLYKYFGIDETKLIFTPYAVDNDYFQKECADLNKDELKIKMLLPLNSKIILFCGKLISKKNPLDLLKAFHNLANNENLFLIFVGEGELRTEMEMYINKYNLKNVKIMGFINQSKIAEYYKVADLFVMCSGIGETWGLAVNEIMNFGVPTIVSELVGCGEDLIEEKKQGYIVESNDLIANTIQKAFQTNFDKQLIIDKINNYSFSKIIENLQKI